MNILDITRQLGLNKIHKHDVVYDIYGNIVMCFSNNLLLQDSYVNIFKEPDSAGSASKARKINIIPESYNNSGTYSSMYFLSLNTAKKVLSTQLYIKYFDIWNFWVKPI